MPTDRDQNPGPVAGRAATVRPVAENNKTDPRATAANEASPGAAEDEAQAKQKP